MLRTRSASRGQSHPNLIQPTTPDPGLDSNPVDTLEGNDDGGAGIDDTDRDGKPSGTEGQMRDNGSISDATNNDW